ncbi:hypothetical protein ODI84_18920, partial [Pseudomonas putida]|uniref:hypothetical protein n=1 Tax=Pseudomonas putida TaxID=303 RepID=UPI00126DBFE6
MGREAALPHATSMHLRQRTKRLVYGRFAPDRGARPLLQGELVLISHKKARIAAGFFASAGQNR